MTDQGGNTSTKAGKRGADNRVIITAIALDRPTLVDDIREAAETAGCTIETLSVTSLDSAASVTLLLRIPDGGSTPLRAALVGLTVKYDVKFHIDVFPDGSV